MPCWMKDPVVWGVGVVFGLGVLFHFSLNISRGDGILGSLLGVLRLYAPDDDTFSGDGGGDGC